MVDKIGVREAIGVRKLKNRESSKLGKWEDLI
jgi:hypothetical protein